MRLAFLTSLVPGRRPASGYEVANACVVDALRGLGHDVRVHGWALPETDVPADTLCFGTAEFRNARAGRALQARWLARSIADGVPFAAAKLRSLGRPPFDLNGIDAVVFNSWQVAAAFPDLLRERPWAYLAHNVEARTSRDNALHAQSTLLRKLHTRDAGLLETLEADLTERARFVWTFADEDIAAFGTPRERGASLPLLFPGRNASAPSAHAFDAAMIGTFTWEANAVGLRWLLERVLSHLPSDFVLAVAGDVPAELVRAHPGVRWMGRVDDATAFLAQGTVVPLCARAGTGVQLKTIEVLQSGRAAVATTRALRGVRARPANLRVADDPREFARALAEFASRGRSGESLDVDPTSFIGAQRTGLNEALRRGVEALAI